MIIAWIELNGKTETNLFMNFDEFHKATFNPECEYGFVELSRLNGKTYQERREQVRDKAVAISGMIPEMNLSCGELTMIQNYFEKYGKRYGLLREFHENGIC